MGRDVPDVAEFAKLRHDEMWYCSVVEQSICKRETKDKVIVSLGNTVE